METSNGKLSRLISKKELFKFQSKKNPLMVALALGRTSVE